MRREADRLADGGPILDVRRRRGLFHTRDCRKEPCARAGTNFYSELVSTDANSGAVHPTMERMATKAQYTLVPTKTLMPGR